MIVPNAEFLSVQPPAWARRIAEQRAVRLVSFGSLGRANQIEEARQRRRSEQIVVDIGDDGELEPTRQTLKRLGHIWVELKAWKRIEIVRGLGSPVDTNAANVAVRLSRQMSL